MSKLKDTVLHIFFGNKFSRNGVFFGRHSYIREHAIIKRCGGNISLGNNTKILPYSRIQLIDSNSIIHIGNDVYICYRFSCLSKNKIEIGDHTLIASDVFITDYNHSLDRLKNIDTLVSKPVKIGQNCWIGEKVIILPGVIVGDCCIIGAGSVVTTKIPSYSMAVGNPAKVIKIYNQTANMWESVKKNRS